MRAAASRGVGTLTLYAFSSDNWHRPASEVEHLMELFRRYLESEAEPCRREGVRVTVIGRRDRLAPSLVATIDAFEGVTRDGRRLHLQLAIDYSAREAILQAARLHGASPGPPAGEPHRTGECPPSRQDLTRAAFARLIGDALHAGAPIPDVDLLIRTGGDQRLSDFLLWECAYAELVFTPCLWPDFGEEDLAQALEAFHRRERRFGRVTPVAASGPHEGQAGAPQGRAHV